jgi:hypothetical protein
MDELFLLPKTPIATPRSYWSDGPPSSWQLTSLVMLVEPNPHEISAMMGALRQWQTQPDHTTSKKYDMDLLNHRFGASAMVLPHKPYTMLTAEFRTHNHTAYLGSRNAYKLDTSGIWDPEKALREAKLVHFSDWPLPKPWIMWPIDGLTEMEPDCGSDSREPCREREIWNGLYDDSGKEGRIFVRFCLYLRRTGKHGSKLLVQDVQARRIAHSFTRAYKNHDCHWKITIIFRPKSLLVNEHHENILFFDNTSFSFGGE